MDWACRSVLNRSAKTTWAAMRTAAISMLVVHLDGDGDCDCQSASCTSHLAPKGFVRGEVSGNSGSGMRQARMQKIRWSLKTIWRPKHPKGAARVPQHLLLRLGTTAPGQYRCDVTSCDRDQRRQRGRGLWWSNRVAADNRWH